MGQVRLIRGTGGKPETSKRSPSARGGTQRPPCLSPAGDDDSLLPIPRGVVSHDLGMGGDVLWRELRGLVWLGVNPPQRFHFLTKRECFREKLKPIKTRLLQAWQKAPRDPFT